MINTHKFNWKLALAFLESGVAGCFIGFAICVVFPVPKTGIPVAVFFGLWHVWSAFILADHDNEPIQEEEAAQDAN